MTKAGLIYLTKALALELGPKVRVNGIAPGLVKTDFARPVWEPYGERFASKLPLRRLGHPNDIAGVVLFLCSSYASWVTGVDGGSLLL
jgi:NAD(P)-dependent dehydrogenase (short-subunit alcohol dehydrogenase family)